MISMMFRMFRMFRFETARPRSPLEGDNPLQLSSYCFFSFKEEQEEHM